MSKAKEAQLKLLWRTFVRAMFDARGAWNEMQEIRHEIGKTENMEIVWQKMLAKVMWKSKFEIGLDALMLHWQRNGGLDCLVVDEPETEEEGEE